MTTRLVGKAKCGCTVEATGVARDHQRSGVLTKEVISIQQCPLHKAAPALLEAAKDMIDAASKPRDWQGEDAALDKLQAAIAKYGKGV